MKCEARLRGMKSTQRRPIRFRLFHSGFHSSLEACFDYPSFFPCSFGVQHITTKPHTPLTTITYIAHTLVAKSDAMGLAKLIQRRIYTFLSSKWGMVLLVVGAIITVNSFFQLVYLLLSCMMPHRTPTPLVPSSTLSLTPQHGRFNAMQFVLVLLIKYDIDVLLLLCCC
jgi:hypothetical protein